MWTGRRNAGENNVCSWFSKAFVMFKVYSVPAAAAMKPAIPPVTTSPGALKNNVKKEDGGKVEESSLSSDQLVPDYAARPVIGLSLFGGKQLCVPCFFDFSVHHLTFHVAFVYLLFRLANRTRQKLYLTDDHRHCRCHLTTVSYIVSHFYFIKQPHSAQLFCKEQINHSSVYKKNCCYAVFQQHAHDVHEISCMQKSLR